MFGFPFARCVGGLLAWALAGGLVPESACAASARHLEPDSAALVGLEHAPLQTGEPVATGQRCRSAGAGGLYERDRPLTGWLFGLYNCDDRMIYTLEREIGTGSQRRQRILDALAIPGASFSNAGRDGHISVVAPTGDICAYGGRPQADVVVALHWNSRDRVTARNGILQAWRFNTQRGRIEPTSTRGIVCVRPRP
jgi:hypothetical protein